MRSKNHFSGAKMVENSFGMQQAIKQRSFVKSVQSLMGICSGLIADGALNDAEINFLNTWLREHSDVIAEWPGNLIANRVTSVLSDGMITDIERQDLLVTLQDLTGNFFLETGVAQQDTPALPVDHVEHFNFVGANVCFTGKFVFGTREACQRAIERIGGVSADSVTKQLDCLIIGALCSPDWINTTYGRKIEKAIAYRAEHGKPIIISEHRWTELLG